MPARRWFERIAPIYLVAIAIALGDGLGNFRIFVAPWLVAALSAAALIAFLASLRSLGTAIALVAIAAAATVPVRNLLDPAYNAPKLRAFADGARITIEGTVIREPEDLPERTRLYVSVNRAGAAGAPLAPSSGTVRVAVLDPAAFRVGDELRVTARIRFPRNDGNPGEFDYEGFMARQGIAATMTAPEGSIGTPGLVRLGHRARFPASAIEAIRLRIGEFIDKNLPFPERAEMRALVIGDRGEIEDDLRNTFARTGMAHLLVISGLHLSFVAAAAFALVRLLMMLSPGLSARGYANKIAALAASIAVCGYAAIAGNHVSTSRALVMVLAYMCAVMIDRAREALASLALAAIVICLALPGSTADIGFQLSFASVTAIVLGMRRFAAWFDRASRRGRLRGEGRSRAWKNAEGIFGYFGVSFWALLGTSPLTAYHFNQFSTVGVAANAVVVPIMGFSATVTGLAASALSFVWAAPARALLHVAGLLLGMSNWLAGWFIEWPGAWYHAFTPTMIELSIAYGLLLLWLTAPLPPTPKPRTSGAVEGAEKPSEISSQGWRRLGARGALAIALAVALGADAAWWVRDRCLNPDLRVTFLSVGEGDAAVVRFPGSRVMLIDAGGAYPGYDYGERAVAPYLWSRKIMTVDYLVLSHPDLDHFGGFAYIAENFSPREFWAVRTPSADVRYAALLATLSRERVRTKLVDDSMPDAAIGGVSIAALNPDSGNAVTRNNSSMVLRLGFGAMSLLFTGDIEMPAEQTMLARGADLHAVVLKAPHHGSATSSSADFVEAVRPAVAVISDGYLNRFHFPSQGVVERYRDSGALVLRTDADGAVTADVSREGATVRSHSGKEVRIGSRTERGGR
ncbi:MAG TPA: DNA internalization-related competence protein ComEC/Rec2 [Candidatus Binataceae bacterium]|nr:DNA internalization-related competence protein ComEC/Rec2 [Candidatus Binataceae bacterium]